MQKTMLTCCLELHGKDNLSWLISLTDCLRLQPLTRHCAAQHNRCVYPGVCIVWESPWFLWPSSAWCATRCCSSQTWKPTSCWRVMWPVKLHGARDYGDLALWYVWFVWDAKEQEQVFFVFLFFLFNYWTCFFFCFFLWWKVLLSARTFVQSSQTKGCFAFRRKVSLTSAALQDNTMI